MAGSFVSAGHHHPEVTEAPRVKEGLGVGCFGADDETLHGVTRTSEVSFSVPQI